MFKAIFNPSASLSDAMRGMNEWTMPQSFPFKLRMALIMRRSSNIACAAWAWNTIDAATNLKDFPDV